HLAANSPEATTFRHSPRPLPSAFMRRGVQLSEVALDVGFEPLAADSTREEATREAGVIGWHPWACNGACRRRGTSREAVYPGESREDAPSGLAGRAAA